MFVGTRLLIVPALTDTRFVAPSSFLLVVQGFKEAVIELRALPLRLPLVRSVDWLSYPLTTSAILFADLLLKLTGC
jgi:hypothetical protein